MLWNIKRLPAIVAVGAVLATGGCNTDGRSVPPPDAGIVAPVQVIETAGPRAADLWSDGTTLHQIKPLDAALDTETQWAIYRACDYDPGLFCLVMAIAEHESDFQPDLIGDNGQSIGMMQINTRWHTGRMEALGVTDLTDPVQCAAIAIDYIRELESRYGFEPISHEILMGYNMGPGRASKALNEGQTSTDYSREIMAGYQDYLEELEGTSKKAAPSDCSTESGPAEQSPTNSTNSINDGKEVVKP